MGLSFYNGCNGSENISSCPPGERLTSESINFLRQLGFTITDYGYTGHKKRSDIRRDSLGKGVAHPLPLRFIEIGAKR